MKSIHWLMLVMLVVVRTSRLLAAENSSDRSDYPISGGRS